MEAVTDIVVPDIGDFKQVPVITVHVAPGARVAKGDPLIELESDKAVMEVPSPSDGTIVSVLVKLGDRLSMGERIVTLTASSSASKPAVAGAPSIPDTGAGISARARQESQREGEPARGAEAVGGSLPTDSREAAVYAGPGVRKLARELGIDLTAVRGTGDHGRVVREDLLRFVQDRVRTPAPAPAPAPVTGGASALNALLPWPEPDYAKLGRVEITELTRLQKLSGANLARNWVTIPHVTNFDKADITDTETFRKKLNGEADAAAAKVTMLAFMIKASVSALRAYPRFNVSFSSAGLVQKHYYNIGFAADTPSGLVVAVIRDGEKKGLLEIAIEARALAAKAREGKLSAREMSGGCFTVSSLGGIGGTAFTPIINAPEVAILGAGRAEIQPVWDGTGFAPRLIQPLALSWDHRAVDGAMAARFLRHIADCLQDVRKLVH